MAGGRRPAAWALVLRMTTSTAYRATGVPWAFTGEMASLVAIKAAGIGRTTLWFPPPTMLGRWLCQGGFKLLLFRGKGGNSSSKAANRGLQFISQGRGRSIHSGHDSTVIAQMTDSVVALNEGTHV